MTSCLNGKELTMSRRFLITAATWTLLGTTLGWAGSPGPEVRTAGLDLRSLAAHSAKVDSISGTAAAVRVTFQPAEWPNVNLAAPRGQAWDWNSHGFLLLAVRNPEQHEIEFGIRIDDDVAADGNTHCRTALTRLNPGESTIVSMALRTVDPMVHGMRGLPAYPDSRSLNASGQGPFNLGYVVALQIFLHRPSSPCSLEIQSAQLAPSSSLDGIVDALGQLVGCHWFQYVDEPLTGRAYDGENYNIGFVTISTG